MLSNVKLMQLFGYKAVNDSKLLVVIMISSLYKKFECLRSSYTTSISEEVAKYKADSNEMCGL